VERQTRVVEVRGRIRDRHNYEDGSGSRREGCTTRECVDNKQSALTRLDGWIEGVWYSYSPMDERAQDMEADRVERVWACAHKARALVTATGTRCVRI
jgi:hypothetical protein